MKKLGGVREAASILASLLPEERNRILETIAEKNTELAEALKENMVVFEDLQYLTVNMLVDLFKEIDINDLALGLRIGSEDLKNHILGNISKRLGQDILDVLNGPPRPVTEVQRAVDKVMSVVRKKLENGELIIKKDGTDEYV